MYRHEFEKKNTHTYIDMCLGYTLRVQSDSSIYCNRPCLGKMIRICALGYCKYILKHNQKQLIISSNEKHAFLYRCLKPI